MHNTSNCIMGRLPPTITDLDAAKIPKREHYFYFLTSSSNNKILITSLTTISRNLSFYQYEKFTENTKPKNISHYAHENEIWESCV